MDAALSVFAKVGVRAATLEDVAALAGVTRGAVYWHFADKAALVSEVVAGLQWPLDIGSDVAGYEAHQQPLRLLHQQLSLQLARCMEDPVQWRTIQLVLCHGLRADLPADAMAQIERAMIRAARHVAQVMAIARERHQLREGLRPAAAARCLHTVGIGMLSARANEWPHARQLAPPTSLDLFMLGICRDSSAMLHTAAWR